MGRFLYHEPLASGLMNGGHNSKGPNMDAWEGELLNTEESLTLVLNRMESDWMGLHPRMRKAFGSKDIVARLRISMNTIGGLAL